MIVYQDNTKMTFEEWLAVRNNSIGASEAYPLVHGNQYTSNLEIFWTKISGLKPSAENLATWRGRKSENIMDEMYPYFDGNDESIYINDHNNKVLKECINLKATIFNSKYPYHSSTPDREIQDFGVFKGMGKGALEYKSTQSYILKKYTTPIPPEFTYQLCQQVMTGEYNYGEIFIFVDNRTCQCHFAEKKDFKSTWQRILDVTIPFWENVLKARPIYNAMYEAKRTYNFRLADSLLKDIEALEPPRQNTDGYLQYLSQRYKDRNSGAGTIKGNLELLSLAKLHEKYKLDIKKLESKQRDIEIQLTSFMKDATILDFGSNGKVTWIPNSKNIRIFNNKIK